MSRRRALNPVGGVILTVLIILAAAVLTFVLLTFAGTLIALRHNMRPGEAMDLTTSNLDGTRFEKYADSVVRDVEELRAKYGAEAVSSIPALGEDTTGSHTLIKARAAALEDEGTPVTL